MPFVDIIKATNIYGHYVFLLLTLAAVATTSHIFKWPLPESYAVKPLIVDISCGSNIILYKMYYN